MDYITILRADTPINKRFTIKDGEVVKHPAKPISNAEAYTVHVPDQKAMIQILETINDDPRAVLILGYIPEMLPVGGASEGETYQIRTKANINVEGELVDGQRFFSRTKANFKQSSWFLLDHDLTDDTPEDLRYTTIDQVQDALSDMLPTLNSFICARSNSSRVELNGMPYSEGSNCHFYIQARDAEDIPRFAKALLVHAMAKGFGYTRKRYSKETGEICGQQAWAIFDPTTFGRERLVYDGQPTVKGKGLTVAPARTQELIGDKFYTTSISTPDDNVVKSFKQRTGATLQRSNSLGWYFESDIDITTRINTIEHGVMTLEEYWISEHDHLRAQSPFRDSNSQAAYLGRHKDGTPFLFDAGAKYVPNDRPPLNKFIEIAEKIPPKEWDARLAPVLKALSGEENPLARKSAVKQLVRMSKKLYTMRDIEDAIQAQIQVEEIEDNGDWMAELNRVHALVSMGKDERIATMGYDGRYIFRTDRSFRLKMNNRLTPESDPVGDAWLKHPARHDCAGIEFKPCVSFFEDYNGIPEGDLLNTWTGYQLKAVKGNWNLIRAHLRDVWCGGHPENLEWLLDWFGGLFQNPGDPGRTIIALNSLQGSGKGLIVGDMIIGRIIGKAHGFRAVRSGQVQGEFNAHLMGKIFVYSDEALYGGDKRDAGALKGMIDKDIAITPKGVDTIFADNSISIIMASNESYMAHVDTGDRRMAFLPVSDHRKGDKPYFKALAAEVFGTGANAFLYEMLHRDLSGWEPSDLPPMESSMRGRLMDKSGDSGYQMILKALLGGDPTWFNAYDARYQYTNAFLGYYDNGIVEPDTPGYSWETHSIVINKETFYALYRDKFADQYEDMELDSVFFGELKDKYGVHRELGGFIQTQKRLMHRGKRVQTVWFRPLPQCREVFERVNSRKYEWDIDDDLA